MTHASTFTEILMKKNTSHISILKFNPSRILIVSKLKYKKNVTRAAFYVLFSFFFEEMGENIFFHPKYSKRINEC